MYSIGKFPAVAWYELCYNDKLIIKLYYNFPAMDNLDILRLISKLDGTGSWNGSLLCEMGQGKENTRRRVF